MLAGVSGRLLPGAFLEQLVAPEGERSRHDAARRALTAWRNSARHLGPASSARALLESGAAPLAGVLGFEPPSDVDAYGSALSATVRARDRSGSLPAALVVTRWGDAFDSYWRLAVNAAARRGARWCFIFDGSRLRIVDAGRIYARRHLEFDLDLAIDQPGGPAALMATCAAAVVAAGEQDPRSLAALASAADRFASGVCDALKDGVLSASRDVLQALVVGGRSARRRVDLGDCFEQSLTIVYRILFLLFAEARALVPLWHPIYRESYSVEALNEAAARMPRAIGTWDALRAMTRLAHAGCRVGDLRVTPFNGRLFAPSRTPLAERRGLDDEAARRAVTALATRTSPDRAGRERIAYRDLGVEQLGAVYETLLDYEPRVERARVTLERGSALRKATGSFYTPQPIADYLVRRTLAPLVHGAAPSRILSLRIVDPAMGSGAFLVAACRFLAHTYESALVDAGACHAADVGDTERAAFRRLIAERCLYGVDVNPMAVQLARLSLWLATLAGDRPLSFLDHRLQAGDSLLGAWLTNLARPPRSRSRKSGGELPLFAGAAIGDAVRGALPIRFSLETTPNDTLEQVRAKERALAAMAARGSAVARWKRVADLWCASWFLDRPIASSLFGDLSDVILTDRGSLPPRFAAPHLEAAESAAAAHRFFHWELEFPEVFFDASGAPRPDAGFDAAIGNPPWEMVRADSGPEDARSHARATAAAVVRFSRDAGVYSSQSDGHANRYQLFVERTMALTKPGGRFGLVLPAGAIADHGSARLRQRLIGTSDIDAIVGLSNRRGVFPIHRSVRFVLLTAANGTPTRRIACRLDVDDPADLDAIDGGAASTAPGTLMLTPAVIERISGPGLAIPLLRHEVDLQIAERAAALFPPLGSADGWAASFGRELNASDDRGAFRADGRGLPVVEGKHLGPFAVAIDAARHRITAADARRLLRSDRHERARLGYRDVASATNRVTLIAAILPPRCASTHTIFCLRTPLTPHAQHFLCGLFNSLVVNYLVRTRVTTHVTTAIVERLPIPTGEHEPRAFHAIAGLARALARRRDREAFSRLNARVARLYQLSAAEFGHVLGTFPLVSVEERQRALRIFETQSSWSAS